jgi:hypothetical protein
MGKKAQVGALMVFLALPAGATTYYVDPGCPRSGKGTSPTCGKFGPKHTPSQGAALLTGEDDVLELRGAHPSHGACPGRSCCQGTTGVYDVFTYGAWRLNLSGPAGHPFVIQPFHYGLPDAEEVYLEGVRLTPDGWVQCTDCGRGICAGVPGRCSDVWYYQLPTCDRSQDRLFFARKPDGSITRRRPGIGEMVDTYDAAGWAGACNYNGDSGNTLLVRWGPAVSDPNSTTGIGVNHGRNDIVVLGSDRSGLNRNLTLRGLTLRNGARCAIQSQGVLTNVRIQANRIYQFTDSSTGSSRAITITANGSGGPTNLQIVDNEFFWSTSEIIHTEANDSAPFTGRFAGNWVHDIGATEVLGDGLGGTPNCTTFTTIGNKGAGDYSQFVVEGNLFERCLAAGKGGSGSKGILLESPVDGITVRDNVFVALGTCIKLATEGRNRDCHFLRDNKFYNNVCIAPGSLGGDGRGIWLAGRQDGTNAMTGNSFYNNDFVNSAAEAIALTEASGIYQQNKFVNNLLLDFNAPPGKKLIDWPASGSSSGNEFRHNGLWAPQLDQTPPSPLARVSTVEASCTSLKPALDLDGSANGSADGNLCPLSALPLGFGFTAADIAASDFRLHAASPAIDAGTMVGMPPRTGIHNPLAGAHGLPDYTRLRTASIASAPDIGAYEVALADGGFESGSIDGPWIAPVADYDSRCAPAEVHASAPIRGLRSLQLTAEPCANAPCIGCKAPMVYELLEDLVIGRPYTLRGTFRRTSGGLSSPVRIDIGPLQDLPCSPPPLCPISPTCSLQITGTGDTAFTCPSVLVPESGNGSLAIDPVAQDGGGIILLDDLELR